MEYSENDKNLLLKMVVEKTDGFPGHLSLVERLQRLLDLPCEICNDGEVVERKSNKIERLESMLRNAIKFIENDCGTSIIGTDAEDEIGITQEEYDDLME